MHAVLYRRTAGSIEMCLLLPWRLLGRYRASSCLMAASSGFWGSPRNAASGNAICIASTCSHGHQNGLQWRCICFLPPLFLLTVIVPKDHVMVGKINSKLHNCCLLCYKLVYVAWAALCRQSKPFWPPLGPADKHGHY
jgi:hypothetical protein